MKPARYSKAIVGGAAGAAAPSITVLVIWALNLAGLMSTAPDMNEVAIVIATLIVSLASGVFSYISVYWAPKNEPMPGDLPFPPARPPHTGPKVYEAGSPQ